MYEQYNTKDLHILVSIIFEYVGHSYRSPPLVSIYIW